MIYYLDTIGNINQDAIRHETEIVFNFYGLKLIDWYPGAPEHDPYNFENVPFMREYWFLPYESPFKKYYKHLL